MAATLRPFFDELCDHAVQAGAKLRCAIGLLKQGKFLTVIPLGEQVTEPIQRVDSLIVYQLAKLYRP